MPPRAPPAFIRTANQDALDTIDRLVYAQRWAGDEQAGVPVFDGDDPAAGRAAYLDALDDWWAAPVVTSPGNAPLPRRRALASRLAGVMKDEATLRRLDGTLSDDDWARVAAFAGHRGSEPPPSVRGYELMIGDTAYAGALVLTAAQGTEGALLFLPDRGWETYPDLPALLEATELQLRTDIAAETHVSGVLAGDLATAANEPGFVTTRALAGDGFGRLAARMVEAQRERIEAQLDASILPAPRMQDIIDVESILAQRHLRLARRLQQERLAAVPANVASDWQSALGTLTGRDTEAPDVPTAKTFEWLAREALQDALGARGIATPVAGIRVGMHPLPDLGTPWAALGALANGIDTYVGKPREVIPLTELAMRNVGKLEKVSVIAMDAGGHRIPGLGHDVLKALVRELDVTSRYGAHLRHVFQTSPEGIAFRTKALADSAARLRFEAADARLSYYRPDDEPGSFIFDRSERGYQWVRAALDSPTAGHRKVEGHDVFVSNLTYSGHAFDGILVFGARDPRSSTPPAVASEVYYTPDAPDGIALREFGSREEAIRSLLGDSGLRQYLLHRLPTTAVRRLSNGSLRFASDVSDENASAAVSGRDTHGATMAAFDLRAIDGNFLEVAYDQSVARLALNLESVAHTTRQADVDSIVPDTRPEAIATMIAVFVGAPAQAGWHAYDLVREGSYSEAVVAFAGAYAAALDFVPGPAAWSLGGGTRLARPRPGVPVVQPRAFLAAAAHAPPETTPFLVRAAGVHSRVVATYKRLRPVSQLDEPRFAKRRIPLDEATAVTDGVYTVHGRQYIEDGGQIYGVIREGQHWRIVDHDRAGDLARGGAVTRENGRWAYLGLRGGMDAGGAPPLRRDGSAVDVDGNRARVADLIFAVDDTLRDAMLFTRWRRQVTTIVLADNIGLNDAEEVIRRLRRARWLRECGFAPDDAATLPPHWQHEWQRALAAGRHATAHSSAFRLDPETGNQVATIGRIRGRDGVRIAGTADLGPLPQGPLLAPPHSTGRGPSINFGRAVELAPHHWPRKLLYYPPASALVVRPDATQLTIRNARLPRLGLNGITLFSPEFPADYGTLSAILGHNVQGRSSGPTTITINVNRLLAETDLFGDPAYRIFAVEGTEGTRYVLTMRHFDQVDLVPGQFTP